MSLKFKFKFKYIQYKIKKLRSSVGLGVRLEVMNRVPITVGWGYPVNPKRDTIFSRKAINRLEIKITSGSSHRRITMKIIIFSKRQRRNLLVVWCATRWIAWGYRLKARRGNVAPAREKSIWFFLMRLKWQIGTSCIKTASRKLPFCWINRCRLWQNGKPTTPEAVVISISPLPTQRHIAQSFLTQTIDCKCPRNKW